VDALRLHSQSIQILRQIDVLELGFTSGGLHHVPDRIDDNVWSIDDDEVSALLCDTLLAILRNGQQVVLEFLIIGAAKFVCAYVDERLIPSG